MPELREDPLSGDWIILSPGRAKRPEEFGRSMQKPRKAMPLKGCPFEDLRTAGSGVVFQTWPNRKKWRIAVVENKYPALIPDNVCAHGSKRGIYQAKTGIGTHELVITRDHNKSFADIDPALATRVFRVFQDRYRAANNGCNAYAASFFNYGPSVGASIWHPHYQLLAIPFVPPHIIRSLHRAKDYAKEHHRCLRCAVVRDERAGATRVIDENRCAIALAPYASKRPFEVSVLPKKHFPRFEDTPPAVIADVAALSQSVLLRLRKYAGDPDLNFFIHSAPLAGGDHSYHHWHMEILPNLSYIGGWEIATGIYINVIDPDEAAKVLRGDLS